MVRSLARWVVFAAGSVLLGLVLIALALYWYFVRNGPSRGSGTRPPWLTSRRRDADEVTDLDELRASSRTGSSTSCRTRSTPVEPADRIPFNRYSAGSRSDPGVWPVNWNRTFHLEPAPDVRRARGVALLLHGLTDSPYSMRSIGEHLAVERLRGRRAPAAGARHGAVGPADVPRSRTCRRPCGWRCATCAASSGRTSRSTSSATRTARRWPSTTRCRCSMARPLPMPAGLVLMSPAIAISRLAVIGRTRRGSPTVPGFARAAWQVIATEFDPYKYNSFSFHAAGETHRLTTPDRPARPAAGQRPADPRLPAHAGVRLHRRLDRAGRRRRRRAARPPRAGRPRARAVRRESLCRGPAVAGGGPGAADARLLEHAAAALRA